MKAGPLTDFMRNTDLFKNLPETLFADLETELELVQLSGGEILFRQGDPGDSLYIVKSGQLDIILLTEDNQSLIIDILNPGSYVGEIALMSGQPRNATAKANRPSIFIKFPRRGFRSLMDKYPEAMTKLGQIIVPRLQRTQLAAILSRFFDQLAVETLHELQAKLKWQRLFSDDVLFHQGDDADAMFIVVNGRLRIVVKETDGEEILLTEIGRGEIVGEFALFTRQKRSATVYAVRDTDVVALSTALFESLVVKSPQAILQMTRGMIEGRQKATKFFATHEEEHISVAVVPITPHIQAHTFISQLANCLTKFGSTLHLTSERLRREFGSEHAVQMSRDDPMDITLVAWLNAQEERYQTVIYRQKLKIPTGRNDAFVMRIALFFWQTPCQILRPNL